MVPDERDAYVRYKEETEGKGEWWMREDKMGNRGRE